MEECESLAGTTLPVFMSFWSSGWGGLVKEAEALALPVVAASIAEQEWRWHLPPKACARSLWLA